MFDEEGGDESFIPNKMKKEIPWTLMGKNSLPGKEVKEINSQPKQKVGPYRTLTR